MRTKVKKHKRGSSTVREHSRSTSKIKQVPHNPNDRLVDINEMYESLGSQWSSLYDSVKELEDKLWNMRVQGALDGALPVISMEMVQEQLDKEKEQLEEVDRKLEVLRPFKDQKLTIKQYTELIRK